MKRTFEVIWNIIKISIFAPVFFTFLFLGSIIGFAWAGLNEGFDWGSD